MSNKTPSGSELIKVLDFPRTSTPIIPDIVKMYKVIYTYEDIEYNTHSSELFVNAVSLDHAKELGRRKATRTIENILVNNPNSEPIPIEPLSIVSVECVECES